MNRNILHFTRVGLLCVLTVLQADPNCGSGFGLFTLDHFQTTDWAESVLVQPDSKILPGGFAQSNWGRSGCGLARFIP